MREHGPPRVVVPVDPRQRTFVDTEAVRAHMFERLRVPDLDRAGIGVFRIVRVSTVQATVTHQAGVQMRQRVLVACPPGSDLLSGFAVVLADARVRDRIEVTVVDGDRLNGLRRIKPSQFDEAIFCAELC